MAHEFVDEHFATLVVDVVVACAVDEQEIALEAFGIGDWRTFAVAFGVVLWGVHVAFLIDGVVESLVGNEGYGYAGVEHVGIAEHAVEGLAAAAAPSCHADAAEVDE